LVCHPSYWSGDKETIISSMGGYKLNLERRKADGLARAIPAEAEQAHVVIPLRQLGGRQGEDDHLTLLAVPGREAFLTPDLGLGRGILHGGTVGLERIAQAFVQRELDFDTLRSCGDLHHRTGLLGRAGVRDRELEDEGGEGRAVRGRFGPRRGGVTAFFAAVVTSLRVAMAVPPGWAVCIASQTPPVVTRTPAAIAARR